MSQLPIIKDEDLKNLLTEAEAMVVLKRTLIVCPVYDRPYLQTEILINTTVHLGAGLYQSRGISDVALHRNLSAAETVKQLKAEPRKFDSIFMIDGDMTASPHHIAVLSKMAHDLGCGVSGLYSKKSDPSHWCARPMVAAGGRWKDVELVPVRVGLGCLAFDAIAFERLVDNSEGFQFRGGADWFPALFQSRLVTLRDGTQEWQSEDLYFCEQCWKSGTSIYLAPVPFGHITTMPVMSTAEGLWMP